MAVAVEEHGREIVEVYLQDAQGRLASRRASDVTDLRKPTETVVTHTPASPERAVLASRSLEEKLERLRSLQRGEVLGLPAAEPARPTG
jgi:hypothetical protein